MLNQMEDPNHTRVCMFCSAELANRGEAYYDHLNATPACQQAWQAWTENLETDRVSGG
jgi:hypothetical protein